MTSNVGAKNITENKTQLGFAASEGKENSEVTDVEKIRELVMGDLRRTFKPEFLNRIDDIIVFHQLTRDNIREIARNMLRSVNARMSELGIELSAEDSAIDVLADKGFDPVYGARPLRRAIQSSVEDAVAEKMLDGEFAAGDKVIASGEDGKVVLRKAAPEQPEAKETAAAAE